MSVEIDERDGVPVVLLDRPAKRNALDMPTVQLLTEAIASAPAPALVLGSSDPTIFSSGVDLTLTAGERARVSDSLYALYLEMRSTSKILLSAASGHAVGGGAQLLVASDLRIASPDLNIRFVGPGHGLVVGAWGLPSLVGRGRALELCLSMRQIQAAEANAIGLIDRIADDPVTEAVAEASRIRRLDHDAIAAMKRIMSISDQTRALVSERAHNSKWDGSIPARPDTTNGR